MTLIKLKSLLAEAGEEMLNSKTAKAPDKQASQPKVDIGAGETNAEEDVNSRAELEMKFKSIKTYLLKAIKASAEYYQAVQNDPDSAEGTEGNELSALLEKVYAAFSTGNPKDTSMNDEIFK